MAKEEDLNWLKDFVAKQGPQAVEVRNAKGEKESVTDFLEQVTEDTPASKQPSTEKQEKLQRRAEKEGAASQERLQREQEKKEQEAARLLKEKQEQTQAFALRTGRKTLEGVSSAISPTIDRVGALPTVGGIGLLLLILGILLVLVVRVNANGDTRAKQFWYMLTGRAKLQGSITPTGSSVGNQNVVFGQDFNPNKNYVPPATSGSDLGGQKLTNTTNVQSNGANLGGKLDIGF